MHVRIHTHNMHKWNYILSHKPPGKILGSFFFNSWYRALLMYSSITNKMQRYTVVFITVNALCVSGGSSAPSSGAQNCIHSIGYLSSFYCFLWLSRVNWNSLAIAIRSRKSSTGFRRFLRPSSGAQNCTHSIRYLSSFFCFLWLSRVSWQCQLTHNSSTNTRCCVYSIELLMMGRGTAWNT
jgi:hypothetical protein